MIFRRQKVLLFGILIPASFLVLYMWIILNSTFKKYGLVPISDPIDIFNSSNIGDYQIGIQKEPFPGPQVGHKGLIHLSTFKNTICAVKVDGKVIHGLEGINCTTIDNGVQFDSRDQ